MRKMKAPAYFVHLFSLMFLLVALAATLALNAQTPALRAQTPAAGTKVVVKMTDTVDSASDPAGKQYHATVTAGVDAGNGVKIDRGSAAMITLTSSGSGYAAQLTSVTINGQVVAVTSNSATVSALAQNVQAKAAGFANSVLGGLGHHVNAPPSVAAAASGQHVSLPIGTSLTFTLGQPSGSGGGEAAAGSTAAPAANTAPANETASAAPAQGAQPMQASAAPVAAPGQHWWLCRYHILKDRSQPVLGSIMYYALFPASDLTANKMTEHFSGYVHAKLPGHRRCDQPRAGLLQESLRRRPRAGEHYGYVAEAVGVG